MSELLKKINLLYVEDDESIRPTLARVLERKVNNLYVAQDGQEGYDMFLDYNPDVILTDIKMPKLTGIEMAKKIKEHNKSIPIIVTSAHSEAGFFLEAIELGIDAYLLKPIDRSKLLTTLETNAKITLYEREKEQQQKLLQAVIDLQPSIIFSSDDNKKALFANELFYEFFCDEKKEDAKSCDYDAINKNSIVKIENQDDDVFWLDYMFAHLGEDVRICIQKEYQTFKFLVKTKLIETPKIDETIVVITLIEL